MKQKTHRSSQSQDVYQIQVREPSRRTRWHLIGWGIGFLVVGGTGLYWSYRALIQHYVLPQIEAEIETAIGLATTLGSPSFHSPWHLELDQSEIKSLATIPSTQVIIDIRRTLSQRRLTATIQLMEPQVMLSLPLGSEFNFETSNSTGGSLPLEQLDINVVNGQVSVESPATTTDLTGLHIDTSLLFSETNLTQPEIDFQIEAQFQGQPVALAGRIDGRSRAGSLTLSAQALPLDPLPSWIPESTAVGSPTLGGSLDANIELGFSFQDQVQWTTDGQISLSEGALELGLSPYPFADIQANLDLQSQTVTIRQFQISYADVPVLVDGTLTFEELGRPDIRLIATVPDVSLAQDIQQITGIQLPFEAQSDLSASVTVAGSWPDLEVKGAVQSIGATTVDQVTLSSFSSQFRADLDTQTLNVEQLDIAVADGRIQGTGSLQVGASSSLQANLQIKNIRLNDLASDYETNLPYDLGMLNANVEISAPELDPSVNLTWQTSGLDLDSQGQLSFKNGRFDVSDVIVQLAQNQGQLTALGEWTLDGPLQATVTANQVDLDWFQADSQGVVSGTWIIDGTSTGITPQTFEAVGDLEFSEGLNVPTAQGEIQAAAATGTINISGDVSDGQLEVESTGQLQFVDAVVSQGNQTITSPRITADFEASGVLNPLKITQPDLSQVLSNATINLPQGATLSTPNGPYSIPDMIQSNAIWDGQALRFEQSQIGSQIAFAGAIPLDFATGAVGPLDLSLQVESFDIGELPLPGVAGTVDLQVQIQGSLSDPELVGQMNVADFQVAGLIFQDLSGPIRWNVLPGRSLVQLESSNGTDQISATLSTDLESIAFDLKHDQIQITGERNGEVVAVTVDQFPLAVLDPLIPIQYPQDLSGTLSSTISGNWAQARFQGQAEIQDLRVSDVEAEDIDVTFAYQDQELVISQADLTLLDSLYQADGSITLPPDFNLSETQFNLQIQTTNGRLQDIVSTLKWDSWDDLQTRGLNPPALGPAMILEVPGEDVTSLSLFEQLQAFVAFRQDSNLEPNTSPLPAPTALEGDFTATVRLGGTLEQPNIDLNLEGQQWSAESYQLETVKASGSFQDQTVILNSILLQTGERLASFEGTLGFDQQQGTLQIQDLPLDLVQPFLPSDLSVGGNVNTQIDLRGSLRDPQLQGSFEVIAAEVNNTPIASVSGQLDYSQGRWDLQSSIQVDSDLEPIAIQGSVPYQLPLSQASPESDHIYLNLDIQQSALDWINIFTDQVQWHHGSSQLQVELTGTLQAPLVEGVLMFEQGEVELALLADPVTDLNGTVVFDLSHLNVEDLRGQIGQGALVAAGQLPLTERATETLTNPLTANLQQAEMTVPQLFEGQVDGNIVIEGSLAHPSVTGHLRASEGNLTLSPQSLPDSGASQSSVGSIQPNIQPDDHLFQPQLRDLRLEVGPQMQVESTGIFSFEIAGNLRVNGSLAALEPLGTINLLQGSLNLPLGSGFRLDRTYRNQVVFTPQQGLDPDLDLRLLTRVVEVTGSPTPVTSSEPALSSSQTIEITATVDGLASQLNSNQPGIIQLQSRPARSEQEIVALLGTSALAGLGTGTEAAALAAEQTIHALGEQIGLDDLRLGPVVQVDRRSASRSNVGFELEMVRDLTRSLSISGRLPLSDPQPFRYSLRYLVSDELLLRLNTDFNESSSANVNFETRF